MSSKLHSGPTNRLSLLKRTFRIEPLECRMLLAADITFAEAVPYELERTPWLEPHRVTVADINRDGMNDLVFDTSVMLGNGDGTFEEATRTGMLPSRGVAVGDFDGDGYVDMVSTDFEETPQNGVVGFLRLVRNQGVHDSDWLGFGEREVIFSRAREVMLGLAAGDLDTDGDVDLVVGTGVIRVFLNNGTSDGQWRGFAEPTDYVHRNFDKPITVTTADVNGDGHLDILASNQRGRDISVLLGSGDGQFVDPVNYSLEVDVKPATGLSVLGVGDLDGDGNLDIVAPNYTEPWGGSDNVVVVRGVGDGTFTEPELVPAPGVVSYPMVVVDLDGDGDLDIAGGEGFVRGGGDLSLLKNSGDGLSYEHDVISLPGCVCGLASAELNGDGRIDLIVVGDRPERSVSVLLNTTEPAIPTTGDVNRDGVFDQLDIVEVLQAAKYLTGQPASFDEGDWNSDGVFDQLDIVTALAAGNYRPG